MKLLSFKIILFFPFLLLGSCINKEHKEAFINDSDVIYLKNKYNAEVLNYFQELVFNKEYSTKKKNLQKWDSDIYITVINLQKNGDGKNRQYIEKAICKIDSLNLPIKLFLEEKESKKTNLKIYFGSQKKLSEFLDFDDDKEIRGFAGVSSKHGKIYKVNIGIATDKCISPKERESVVLEEISQSLGALSDSFSYPYSVNYEATNTSIEFLQVDKEILKLLYEKSIPFNLSFEAYNKAFKEELYNVDYRQKIINKINNENIKSKTLHKIAKTCFIDDLFYKHPKNIEMCLNGGTKNDSIFINSVINYYNKELPQVSLSLVEKSNFSPNAGITVSLIKDEKLGEFTSTRIINYKGEISIKRFKSDINISYSSIVDDKKLKYVIIKSIYKALGPVEIDSLKMKWNEDNKNLFAIDDEYIKILNFIYSDEFIDGLELDEYLRIINKVKLK